MAPGSSTLGGSLEMMWYLFPKEDHHRDNQVTDLSVLRACKDCATLQWLQLAVCTNSFCQGSAFHPAAFKRETPMPPSCRVMASNARILCVILCWWPRSPHVKSFLTDMNYTPMVMKINIQLRCSCFVSLWKKWAIGISSLLLWILPSHNSWRISGTCWMAITWLRKIHSRGHSASGILFLTSFLGLK